MVLVGAVSEANEFIIDPTLMNHETWAEPYFATAEELEQREAANAARDPSSAVAAADAPVKNADEYLGVLKSIPASEPSMSRAWIEYKILHEN